MKNGFTLIELLAVIVILAIIALIATPIVLSIINDSKESASLRSAEMYLKGLETSVAVSTLDNKVVKDGTYSIIKNGNICLEYKDNKCTNELKVEMSGEVPQNGSKITLKDGKIKNLTFIYGDKIIIMDENNKLAYANGPVLLEGDGLIYSGETGTTFSFKSSADVNEFEKVQVDGSVVDSSNYTISEGSTIITFSRDYMLSITDGEHTIEIFSESGIAKGSFETETAGLYEPDGTMKYSWKQLTSMEYKTIGRATGINPENGSFVYENCAILNVDENGVLIDGAGMPPTNESSKYFNNNGTLIIDNSVKKIGDDSYRMFFSNGYALDTLIIPDSVTSIIGGNTFYCVNIKNIIIGSGLKEIVGGSFTCLPNLEKFYFKSTTPPTFSGGFNGPNYGENCTFYFKNKEVADAFVANTSYLKDYATISTDYDW